MIFSIQNADHVIAGERFKATTYVLLKDLLTISSTFVY